LHAALQDIVYGVDIVFQMHQAVFIPSPLGKAMLKASSSRTLDPKPATLNPQPPTLDPQPQSPALNPNPQPSTKKGNPGFYSI
jgi:hypothetical protein